MDYIKSIRRHVGHEKIILNFSGACILNDKGEILLQKRADKQKWGFPGGAIELGESLEEAAEREIFEETGLVITLNKLIGVYSKYEDQYPNGDVAQIITHLFAAEILSGNLKADHEETLELKFFAKNNFPELVNSQHEDFYSDICKSPELYPFIR